MTAAAGAEYRIGLSHDTSVTKVKNKTYLKYITSVISMSILYNNIKIM